MLHCYIIHLQIECNYDLHNVLMIGRYLTWEIKRAKKKKNIKRNTEVIMVGR